jgi:hypothetical protein
MTVQTLYPRAPRETISVSLSYRCLSRCGRREFGRKCGNLLAAAEIYGRILKQAVIGEPVVNDEVSAVWMPKLARIADIQSLGLVDGGYRMSALQVFE